MGHLQTLHADWERLGVRLAAEGEAGATEGGGAETAGDSSDEA